MPLALALAMLTIAADDWECPGLPCFIVNAQEYRNYTHISQTCGPVDSFDVCMDLQAGRSFTTGTYTHKVSKPHGCTDYWGCMQTSCVQGSVANCTALCDRLQLLPLYQAGCRDYCSNTRASKCASSNAHASS